MQEPIFKERSDNLLRDFYNVVFRHKQKLVLFFICILVAVAAGTFFMSDTYQSDAKLLVQIGRESINLDQTTPENRGGVGIVQNRKKELNSELEILKSEDLAAGVVDALGVNPILQGEVPENPPKPSTEAPVQSSKRSKAIRKLMKNLEIVVVKESNIIDLAYKAESPRLAADVLAKLIDCFLEKRFKIYRTEGAYDFFKQQKERLGNALAGTEGKIKQLKKETQIGALDTQRHFLLERKSYMQREIEGTQSAIAVSKAKVDVLKTVISSLPERLIIKEITGGALSAADNMRSAVNELELKQNEILGSFTEKNVFAKNIRRQISNAKELLSDAIDAKTVEKGLNETRQRLELDLSSEESELSSLRSKAGTLSGQMETVQAELQTIIDTEVLLNSLQRDRDLQEINYRKYARKLEQSRIDGVLEQAQISNIRVFQKPTLALKPVSPKPLLNLFLGALLGLFGGLGLILLTDYFDHSFNKPEDIEGKLEIPILGAVPALITQGATPKEKRVAAPVKFSPGSSLKKACDICLERLLTVAKGQPNNQRIFSITSCHRGEGVSTLSAYLAAALAERSEGRILLVDTHLQDPQVHRIFGIDNSPGLAESLLQSQTVGIRPASVKNLDILCAGKGETAGQARLFESKAFTDLLNLWRNEYSYVLLDTPAVWDESHAVSLGSAVDGVIMVVEAEKTRWEVALRAKNRLIDGGAELTGGILNKRRFYVPKWLYKTL